MKGVDLEERETDTKEMSQRFEATILLIDKLILISVHFQHYNFNQIIR